MRFSDVIVLSRVDSDICGKIPRFSDGLVIYTNGNIFVHCRGNGYIEYITPGYTTKGIPSSLKNTFYNLYYLDPWKDDRVEVVNI